MYIDTYIILPEESELYDTHTCVYRRNGTDRCDRIKSIVKICKIEHPAKLKIMQNKHTQRFAHALC